MAVRPPRTVLDNNIDGLSSQTYIAPDQSSTSYDARIAAARAAAVRAAVARTTAERAEDARIAAARVAAARAARAAARTARVAAARAAAAAEEDYGDIPDFEVNKASMFPEMSTNTMLIAGGVLAVAFVIFKITRR